MALPMALNKALYKAPQGPLEPSGTRWGCSLPGSLGPSRTFRGAPISFRAHEALQGFWAFRALLEPCGTLGKPSEHTGGPMGP